MAYLRTTPYALDCGKGQNVGSFRASLFVKATSEQTGGAFNLFEVTLLPAQATSLHIHYAEDVTVYVLEGALTFFWGGEKREALAGTYLFMPRGTPHGFRAEHERAARILYMTIPAGLDRLVIEQNFLVPNSDFVAAAARHKIEILGPLPE